MASLGKPRRPVAALGSVKSKLDHEDGRQVYEIEFYVSGSSGYTEYDYEIEAATGAVTEWDAESVYD